MGGSITDKKNHEIISSLVSAGLILGSLMESVLARFAYSYRMHDLQTWNLSLILRTGRTEDFATRSTMMTPFINGELYAAV